MAVANQVITDRYAIYHGDCIDVMAGLPDGKVGLSIYSPPFGGLYHYSSNDRDLSNATDYAEFFEHYEYVIRDLARITMPGRMTAVHAADIPSGNTGNDHLVDFSGDIIRAHERHGWKYVARYSIWKEPLGVRNRTLAKSLAHKTIVDDASKCSNAAADYLLVFRNKGENTVPVPHPQGLTYYAGDREIPAELAKYKGWEGKQTENRYSHWIWRQYASAFWDDIRLGRVLPFKDTKDPDDEKHVHPLQLDVIERCIKLWSAPGDIVFSPFAGIGSEGYQAITFHRRFIGIELKRSYFEVAAENLRDAESKVVQGDMPLFHAG